MIEAIVTAAWLAVIGDAVLRIGRVSIPCTMTGALALRFVTGVAMNGILLHVLVATRIPITRGVLLVLVIGCIAVCAALPSPGRESIRVPKGAALLLAAPLVTWFVGSLMLPIRDFDGRATWLPKARAIALSAVGDGAFFQGMQGLNLHNHYPLLMPLNAASIMLLVDDTSNESVRVLFALTAMAVFLVARDLMVQSAGATGACVIAAVAWLPVLIRIEGGVLAAYNDIAVMGFIGLLAMLLIVENRESQAMVLPAIFAAAVILLKNEGLLLVAACLLAAIVTRMISRTQFLLLGGTAAAAVAVLALWRRRVPQAYDERYDVLLGSAVEKLHRLPSALTAYVHEATDAQSWAWFWIAAAASLIAVLMRRQRSGVFAAIFLVGAWASHLLALTVTSWNIPELASVAVDRLLTHMIIPGAYLIAIALSSRLPRQDDLCHPAGRTR